MRVWVVVHHDAPAGIFMTQQEAEMFAQMKWPERFRVPGFEGQICIFEWDETQDFYQTMDRAYEQQHPHADQGGNW
jgi:hypothetical protein